MYQSYLLITLLSLCSADVSAEVLTARQHLPEIQAAKLTVLIKCYLQLRPFATSLHRLQQNRPSCTCDSDTQTETSVQSENRLNYISLKKKTVQQIKEYNNTESSLHILLQLFWCNITAVITFRRKFSSSKWVLVTLLKEESDHFTWNSSRTLHHCKATSAKNTTQRDCTRSLPHSNGVKTPKQGNNTE